MAKTSLSFSLSIYKKEAIEEAMHAYGAYARFSLQEEPYAIAIDIEPLHEDLATKIIDSFCNHVLFETIILHRKEKGGTL